MNSVVRQLVIQQAVHGYAGGHRLLDASPGIPESLAAVMLEFSDVLGQEPVARRNGYLSGYPHAESRRYVLARTWADTRAKRPGSVITHSLVLDYSLLATVHDLTCLLKLFARPEDLYSGGKLEPIVRTKSALNERTWDGAEPAHLEFSVPGQLLTGLYGPGANARIELPSHGADADEMLALAAWRQMWPSFRRNFAFFTQPDAGKLQVTSACLLQFSARLANTAEADIDRNVSYHNAFAWRHGYEALRADMVRRGPTALRKFLAHYVYDSKHPRYIVPLLSAYHDLKTRRKAPLSDLLELTSDEIAADGGLAAFKEEILFQAMSPSVDASTFYKALELFGSNEADARAQAPKVRVPELSEDRISAVLSNLHPTSKAIASHAARQVLYSLPASVAAANAPRDVLDFALSLRPELFETRAFWVRTDLARYEALDYALAHDLPVLALLEHVGRLGGLAEVEKILQCRPDALLPLLELAVKNGADRAVWLRLAEHGELLDAVFEQAFPASRAFLDATCAIALGNGRLLPAGPEKLRSLYAQAKSDLGEPDIAWSIHGLLVASKGGNAAFALGSECFETVYRAADSYKIPHVWGRVMRGVVSEEWKYSDDELAIELLARASAHDASVRPLALFQAARSWSSTIAVARFIKRFMGSDTLSRMHWEAANAAESQAMETAMRAIEEVYPNARRKKGK